MSLQRRTSSHLRGSCSRGRVRLNLFLLSLFAAPTHVIGYITLAAVAYTASATTTRATVLTQTTATFPCCSSEVLPTMLVTEETREEKAGLWLKELEERKIEPECSATRWRSEVEIDYGHVKLLSMSKT